MARKQSAKENRRFHRKFTLVLGDVDALVLEHAAKLLGVSYAEFVRVAIQRQLKEQPEFSPATFEKVAKQTAADLDDDDRRNTFDRDLRLFLENSKPALTAQLLERDGAAYHSSALASDGFGDDALPATPKQTPRFYSSKQLGKDEW